MQMEPLISKRMPTHRAEKPGFSVKASPMMSLPSPINQKQTPAEDSIHRARFLKFRGEWALKVGSSTRTSWSIFLQPHPPACTFLWKAFRTETSVCGVTYVATMASNTLRGTVTSKLNGKSKRDESNAFNCYFPCIRSCDISSSLYE